jgi:hypothetical protein
MRQTSMLVVLVGLLVGSGTAVAQVSSSADAKASTRASASMRPLGAQASDNASASADAMASQQDARASTGLAKGTKIHGRLVNSLDAKKNKPGDRVEARTMEDVKENGKVVLPKGTHLIGHVTKAQVRGKGRSRSALGVTFDRAELRSGAVIPLRLAVEALATPAAMLPATDGPGSMALDTGTTSAISAGPTGGGLIGGTLGATTGVAGGLGGGVGTTAGTLAGSTVNITAHSAGAVGGLDAGGMLASNSRGVFGMRGVSLASSSSGATWESTLVSSSRSIHLAGGTQMLLRAEGTRQVEDGRR